MSETRWYYVESGQRVGPRPEDDLAAMFRAGALPLDTLVWTAGMTDWIRAGDVEPFAGIVVEAPAPRAEPAMAGARPYAESGAAWDAPAYGRRGAADLEPQGQAAVDPAALEPRPWTRWLARNVDMICAGFLSAPFAPAVALPDSNSQFVMVILTLALWVPVEALMLSAWGATPGKALLRVYVRDAEGRRPSFATAFQRSVGVWVFGLALGIPLLSFVSQLMGFDRLKRNGVTSWDAKQGLHVEHGEPGALRWAVVGVIYAVVVAAAFLSVLAMMQQAGT